MTSVARNHSLVTDGVTQSNVPYRTRVDGHDSAQGAVRKPWCRSSDFEVDVVKSCLARRSEIGESSRIRNGVATRWNFAENVVPDPSRIWCHFDPNSDTPENVKILSNSDMSEFDSRIVKFALSGTGSNPRVKTVFSPIRHTYFLAVFLPT